MKFSTIVFIVIGAIAGTWLPFYIGFNNIDEVKMLLDMGASASAILAIGFTFNAWFRSKQKPLKVKRIQIYNREEGVNPFYALFITNRKDYPVTIDKIAGYSEKTYTVFLKEGGSPELTGPGYRSSKILFEDKNEIVVPAEGYKWVRIEGLPVKNIEKLYTWIESSNGQHIQKCSAIKIIEFDDAMSNGWYDFTSLIKSKIVYRGLSSQFPWVRNIAGKLGNRWKHEF